MQEYFSNNATTTLNGSINNSQTSIVVTSNALFPANAQFRIIIDSEIMTVTAGQAGLTWTVTRNSESIYNGSGATAHQTGATVTQVLTNGSLTNAIASPVAGASWGANTLLTLASIANNYGLNINGPAGAGTSLGLFINAGTNSTDFAAKFQTQALVDILKLRGDGQIIANGPITTPPSISGTVPTTSYGTVPVKIDDQLLSGTAASITFPNPLPTGFRHLLIELQAATNNAVTAQECGIRFNNDSAANYGYQRSSSTGAVIVGQESGAAAQTSGLHWFVAGTSAVAGASGVYRIWIPNYNQSTFKKFAHIIGGNFSTSTFAAVNQIQSDETVEFWNSTAAITRIDLLPLAGLFVVGSTFTLWGFP